MLCSIYPSRCHFEIETNAGSLLLPAGQFDRAVKPLHYSFDQGQAHTQSTLFGGEKRLEDHLLLLFGHPLAGVGQDHAQVAGYRGIDLDRQHALLGHGFQCVSKQAIEYLRQ
ncbi:hypothetical protein D3C76_788820 [compost metagenome]